MIWVDIRREMRTESWLVPVDSTTWLICVHFTTCMTYVLAVTQWVYQCQQDNRDFCLIICQKVPMWESLAFSQASLQAQGFSQGKPEALPLLQHFMLHCRYSALLLKCHLQCRFLAQLRCQAHLGFFKVCNTNKTNLN